MSSLDEMIENEERIFMGRVPKSAEMHLRASTSIPGGVTSSWASSRPTPVWVSHGKGAYVWDVDDNRYIDFHAGYGANVVGHANPAVVAAVQFQLGQGPLAENAALREKRHGQTSCPVHIVLRRGR